jgi:Zinc knuckle
MSCYFLIAKLRAWGTAADHLFGKKELIMLIKNDENQNPNKRGLPVQSSQQPKKMRKSRTCFECGSPDHFAKFCPKKKIDEPEVK